MKEEKFLMFRNRLTKVFRHLGKQAGRFGINCYRLYDHDLPEFPFCIEIYGDKLYVAEYKRRHGMTEEEHDRWIEESIFVMSDVLCIGKQNIYLKLRQRKQGRLGQYQRLGTPPILAQMGKIKEDFSLSQNEIIVEESKLKFIVNLSDYLDTGLFLGHRITRQMVRGHSKEKKVLNLFAYTGSFSVFAAAGGASEIVTVDLSKTYLQWAERNMKANNFTNIARYKYVHADVLQYLKTIPADYFDLIVLDPPTFSNSRRMKDFFDIQKDHVKIIDGCLTALKPGGLLFFSTNYRKFIMDMEKIKATCIKDITKASASFDFEGKLHRYCYLIEK